MIRLVFTVVSLSVHLPPRAASSCQAHKGQSATDPNNTAVANPRLVSLLGCWVNRKTRALTFTFTSITDACPQLVTVWVTASRDSMPA